MEGQTTDLTPLAIVMLLVMVGLTWALPRRFAFCPLLILTCLMPLGQELVLLGLHFPLFRVVLLVGILRVLFRGEAAQLRWTPLDKIFAWWVLVSVVFGTMSKPSMELFVNRMGDAYTAVGSYFFFRCVIADFEDIVTSVRTLAWVSLPLAALMLVENNTGHNPFAALGGVPAFSAIREGHVRCQGAFRHAILAGTFGATLIPLCVALWFYRPQYRRLTIAALIASLVITITARSSGALLALLAGVGGLMFWKWRQSLRLIRRGVVVAILGLALAMNAPVWFLLAKLSSVSGGGGWHRAWLIDQAVRHFDEWWLFGTTYTASWGPAGEVIAADPNMMDITNHYVMEGVKGGMLKLGLFLVIIIVCFKGIGQKLRTEAAASPSGFLIWALGVTLFAHCLSFISVTYFDQIIVIWYWLLAAVCLAIYSPSKSYAPVPVAGEGVDEDVHMPQIVSVI
jgi:hypothetical protein